MVIANISGTTTKNTTTTDLLIPILWIKFIIFTSIKREKKTTNIIIPGSSPSAPIIPDNIKGEQMKKMTPSWIP